MAAWANQAASSLPSPWEPMRPCSVRRWPAPNEAPGHGTHWGSEARHATLPRGLRSEVGTVGTLQEILYGPSHKADGTTNFIGALRRAMASCGYVDIKSFQRCPVVVTANRS